MPTRTPYRAIAFGTGRLTRRTPQGFAIVLWNPDHTIEAGRLPGAGSFCWNGLHAVRAAALEAFRDSRITSVSIRTNQDRPLYRYLRQADGTITGYGCRE